MNEYLVELHERFPPFEAIATWKTRYPPAFQKGQWINNRDLRSKVWLNGWRILEVVHCHYEDKEVMILLVDPARLPDSSHGSELGSTWQSRPISSEREIIVPRVLRGLDFAPGTGTYQFVFDHTNWPGWTLSSILPRVYNYHNGTTYVFDGSPKIESIRKTSAGEVIVIVIDTVEEESAG